MCTVHSTEVIIERTYKNDLCPVEEVSELRFPDDQILGVLHRHSVLEGEDSLLGENAVGNLQAASITSLGGCRGQTSGRTINKCTSMSLKGMWISLLAWSTSMA